MGNERLLTDGEIRNAIKQAHDQAQEYGDDGKPLPEREVAKAQDAKTLREVGKWLWVLGDLVNALKQGRFPESK